MLSEKCKHHPSQNAVAQCMFCGEFMCYNCMDVPLTDVIIIGQDICRDCKMRLAIADDDQLAQVYKIKKKAKMELTFIGIGLVAGFIIGMASGGFWAAIFVGLVGCSTLMALKGIGAASKMGSILASGSYVEFVTGIIGFFRVFFVAPIATISTITVRITQIKQCSTIMTNNILLLEELLDYFAYTQSMEKAVNTKGFNALTAESEELLDNSYAQRVKAIGEWDAHYELECELRKHEYLIYGIIDAENLD